MNYTKTAGHKRHHRAATEDRRDLLRILADGGNGHGDQHGGEWHNGGHRNRRDTDADPNRLHRQLTRALRPLYFPSAFALAMPSRCPSSMISRSNCAIAANMFSMNRPVALRVSTASPPSVDRGKPPRRHRVGQARRSAGRLVRPATRVRPGSAVVVTRAVLGFPSHRERKCNRMLPRPASFCTAGRAISAIPESEEILRASNLGAPVTIADAQSAPARAYTDAARRLNGETMPAAILTADRTCLTGFSAGGRHESVSAFDATGLRPTRARAPASSAHARTGHDRSFGAHFDFAREILRVIAQTCRSGS